MACCLGSECTIHLLNAVKYSEHLQHSWVAKAVTACVRVIFLFLIFNIEFWGEEWIMYVYFPDKLHKPGFLAG